MKATVSVRRVCALSAAAAFAVCLGSGLAVAPEQLKFEVASVKALQDTRGIQPVTRRGADGRIELRPVSLMALLTEAFGLKPYQVSGPAWLTTAYFDVAATAPPGTGGSQIPAMLQSLLAERFKMKFHRAMVSRNVYALVPAPDGAKLESGVADDDPAALGVLGAPGTAAQNGGTWVRAPYPFGVYRISADNGVVHYEFRDQTMDGLADFLTSVAQAAFDQPVVDMTGLKGHYHVDVEATVGVEIGHSPARPPVSLDGVDAPPSASEPGGTIRKSLGKQGLQVVRRQAPVEIIYIDSIEKTPTEN